MIRNVIIVMISILLVAALANGILIHRDGYSKPASDNHPTDDDCGCCTDFSEKESYEKKQLSTYPVMRILIPINTSENNNNFISPASTNIELPSSFSWKNYEGKDYTTPARDQGDCGSCWLFGAIGALESIIEIKEDCPNLNPDLSEQYVLSCIPEAGSCNGGDPYNCAFSYIINSSQSGGNYNGVTQENYFAYQSNFNYIPSCNEKDDDWENHLVPLSDYWQSGFWNINDPNLIDTIKSLIYTKGPVYSMYWVSDYFKIWGAVYHKSTDYYKDINENCPNYVNHGIVIVGWKDDPAIPNGGYWIVKNSWGTEWGYNGFFNLEYNCLNMGAFVAWVDYNPVSFDWEPVADAGGLYQGNINQVLTFDANNSIDAEGDIISYYWDFGDGTYGTGVTSSHVYSQQGQYIVKVTVVDSNNNTAKDTTLVGIEDMPVNINIYGGIGISIDIINHIEENLHNLEWSIDLNGLIYTGKTKNGIIEILPANDVYEISIPAIGVGPGTISVTLDNISEDTDFFILGPLVFLR